MQSKPELEVIVPEWNAPENIRAFFTLRSGGMSAGAYGDKDGFCGLNLGNHVGDNKYSVRGNRRIVTDMLGAEPKWLSQVHSSRVVRAEDNNTEEQADAEFTTAAGIPCVVMTACRYCFATKKEPLLQPLTPDGKSYPMESCKPPSQP